ncbi:hypothetical protein E7Z53_11560 [Kocuria salina]|uniref:hypothetical protein n=1 Tax=Kocuria salina TaxID=1929416 RepID=UPI001592EE71|nr:hypothetical protein [Kocuria salina]NVC24069.1 hypothetical protein [Kocuria salina]
MSKQQETADALFAEIKAEISGLQQWMPGERPEHLEKLCRAYAAVAANLPPVEPKSAYEDGGVTFV